MTKNFLHKDLIHKYFLSTFCIFSNVAHTVDYADNFLKGKICMCESLILFFFFFFLVVVVVLGVEFRDLYLLSRHSSS
jgi:hypothetical protein